MTRALSRLRRRPRDGGGEEKHGYRLLLKDSVIYGGGRTLVKLLSALLLPLYTSFLSPADYGVLGIVLSTTTLIDVIVTLGIDVAFARFYFDEKTEANHRKVITTVFYIKVLYGGLVLGLLALFMPQISTVLMGTAAYAIYFNVSLINEFFTNWTDLPFTLFRLDHRPWMFTAFTAGRVLVQVPVTVGLVVWGHMGPMGVLIGNAVTAFSLNLLALPSYWKRVEWRPDWKHVRSMLDFAFPAIFSTLMFYVLNLSDRYFVQHYWGKDETGLYTVAVSVSQPVYVVMMAFRMAWPQWHYAKLGDPAVHKHLVARSSTYFLGFSLFMGSAMGVFMPILVRLLTGKPAYWGIGPTSLVLSFASIAYSAYFVFWVGSNVAKKNRLIPVIAFVAGAVNVGLNFWAVAKWGMWGAAWTTLAGYSVLAFQVYWISQHYYPIKFEWARLLKLCAATALTLVAGWALTRAVGLTAGPLPGTDPAKYLSFGQVAVRQLMVAPAILLFPLTMWLARFFTPSERARMGGRFRRRGRRGAAKPAAAPAPGRIAAAGAAMGATAVMSGAGIAGAASASGSPDEGDVSCESPDTDVNPEKLLEELELQREEELEEEELEEEEIEAESELPSGGGIV